MSLFPQPVTQLVSALGVPLALAKASFTETGTTTPVNVYQEDTFVNPHPNPVVANAAGIFPPIYLNPALGKVRCRIITAAGDFAAPLVDVDPADSLFSLGGVTNAYLANMPAGTAKANLTAGVAAPTDVTMDALTAALDLGTTAEPGVLQLATNAETVTGVDATKAVTAAGVAAALAASLVPIAASITANGYVTLSNGLIIQWGRVGPVAIDGFVALTFPLAFPAGCFTVLHSPSAPGPYTIRFDSWSLRIDAPTLTGCNLYCASSANSQAISIDWIAIGH